MPISIPASNERRYTCFVCGVEFKTVAEMGKHVVEKHEEGREYILCPLARCRFPVRDVRAHFKAKHPKDAVPTTGQMRAIRWVDQRRQTGRRKPTYKEGFFTSAKNGMKDFHYRSGWELEVYQCLEQMPDVVGYKVEPFPIGYWFQGEHRHYYPDLLVSFADGRQEVWEIKPARQTTLPINEAKWAAAAAFCQARGIEFSVKVKKYIDSLKRHLAKHRLSSAASPPPAEARPRPTDAS